MYESKELHNVGASGVRPNLRMLSGFFRGWWMELFRGESGISQVRVDVYVRWLYGLCSVQCGAPTAATCSSKSVDSCQPGTVDCCLLMLEVVVQREMHDLRIMRATSNYPLYRFAWNWRSSAECRARCRQKCRAKCPFGLTEIDGFSATIQ